MIIRLPGGDHAGEVRHAFHHVTDIVPTVLDYLGLEPPSERRGEDQLPIDGSSIRATIENPKTAETRGTQYFETDGHRALWKDGWKAVAYHRRDADFADDEWELYHVAEDFSECHDLAEARPDKLAELVACWWEEARRNQVLPLDDRGFAERANENIRPHSPRGRRRFVYLNGMQHLGNASAPPTPGRSFRISADVTRDEHDGGVLIAHGSVNSGYCLMIEDGHLVYDFNLYGDHSILRSDRPVPPGRSSVAMEFLIDPGSTSGTASLSIDGAPAGALRLAETFPHFVAFQGLDVGADRLSPVRAGATDAFAFTGGLDQVVVELLDESAGRLYEPRD
jgi:arylsulfatase